MAQYMWILLFPLVVQANLQINQDGRQVRCHNYIQATYQQSYQEGYNCGFWNGQTCYRHKYRVGYRNELRCCNGWTPASGSTCQPVCHGSTTCPNGGTCTSPNVCTCRQGYYAPVCNSCTSIANCQTITCTTSSDQSCTACNDGYYLSQDAKQCSFDENPHLQNVALSEPHIEWINNSQGDHPVGFYFNCSYSYDNSTQDPSLRFNVTFQSRSGATINVVKNDIISSDQRSAILDGEDLAGHLGTSIFCEVRTFSDSRANVSTFAKHSGTPYYVGIRILDTPITIRNGSVYDLYLTATIPVLCSKSMQQAYPEFCTSLPGVSISMRAQVDDNVVLPYCSVTLPANSWANNQVRTLQPFKVRAKFYSGYTNASAYSEFTKMAEPYWQAWFNYDPPAVQFNLMQTRNAKHHGYVKKGKIHNESPRSRFAELLTSPQQCGCVRENNNQMITCHNPPA